MFDPVKERKSFDEYAIGYLFRVKYVAASPMGNAAIHQLTDVVMAWILGLRHEVEPIIPIALEWLKGALLKRENYGVVQAYYQCRLYKALALGNWLSHYSEAIDEWRQARNSMEESWKESSRIPDEITLKESSFPDYMAICVLARDFRSGIKNYEEFIGVADIPIKKSLKPEEFGYLLCRHYENNEFDKKLLVAAGERMLKKYLEEHWLGKGQALCAAMWLRIVYSIEDNAMRPLEILLKAYDNMPHVERPSFLITQ